MLITVLEFRHLASAEVDRMLNLLALETGRGGEEERHAWRNSLPRLAAFLGDSSLDRLHLFFRAQGKIALEYHLPAAPHWCDVVLLGAHQSNPSAVIIELKDWLTRSDTPGPREGLIRRQGRDDLHPSDQVRGYTEYCRRFHSAVGEYRASVHGCVLFTRDFFYNGYTLPPNDRLIDDYPLFSLSVDDSTRRLPDFLARHIDRPDESFAEAFANGVYQQDRGFVRTVAAQLADSATSPLELLDGQRRALAVCQWRAESAAMNASGPRKTVIVVEGPPGSGKSVVAVRLWSSLLLDKRLPEGNVTFVTTSTAQTSNWRALFESAANGVAARGVVVTANEYAPFTTQDVSRINKQFPDLLGDVGQWRDNYRNACNVVPDRKRTTDNQFLVSVVDEAHALINPEHSDARGQFGFAVNFGPQAYHIIRASVVSVFFLDQQQRFREHETTNIDDLRSWATELGADFVGPVDLSGAQFRCGGSQQFADWVDALCAVDALGSGIKEPRPGYLVSQREDFHISVSDSLSDMEIQLRSAIAAGQTARLVASYARPWRTRKVMSPHALPDASKDFNEIDATESTRKIWSKVWNVVPDRGRDYATFITAPPGTPMGEDSLSEVGCPYVVRGFDFDWIGLVWFSDVVWRKEKWVVNVNHVHESGLRRHVQRAQREQDTLGPHHEALLKQLLLGYRILLTRAMRGIVLWFEDEETRRHIESGLELWGITRRRD